MSLSGLNLKLKKIPFILQAVWVTIISDAGASLLSVQMTGQSSPSFGYRKGNASDLY